MFIKRKEHRRLRSFKIIAGLVIMLVLAAVVFFGRGWVRTTAEPKTIGLIYKSSVQNTFNAQKTLLGDPLRQMGYRDINRSSSCQLSVASRMHTEIDCLSQETAYSKLSDLDSSLTAASSKIETSLKNNGWQGTYGLADSPYTSLSRLSKSLSSGIDWQPDAGYTKNVGPTTCLFDSNTAYSKPAAAAISSRFFCSRTIDVFGNPWVTDANGNKYLPAK